MAIDRPEATAAASRATGAQRRTAKEDFVAARGMTAQPTGEESLTPPLRQGGRGEAGLRPDQAIGEAVRCARSTGRRRRRWRPPATGNDPHDFTGAAPSRPGHLPAPDMTGHHPEPTFIRSILIGPVSPAVCHQTLRGSCSRPHADPCAMAIRKPVTNGDAAHPVRCNATDSLPLQARAVVSVERSVAAIPTTRRKAVTPTAIAPMTEKTICHVSDGMVCFTMPWTA